MKKFCLVIAVIALTAPAFAQDTRVRCESDGKMRQCGFAGTGTVTVMHQLSKASCIQGKTWGYSGDTIWVDRGCRADFLVSPMGSMSSVATTAVVCESGGGRHICNVDTRNGVRISRQLSKHGCVEGKDWGYTSDGIWVDRGCRAEFIVGPGPMTSSAYGATSNYHGTVTCESINNTKHRCSADTRFGVSLGRQLSDNACILNQSWGWDSKGIWVTKGCRAEFTLGNP